MKKFVLAAVAAVAIAMTAAPSFAEGLQSQSANIAAGGYALPAGVVPHSGK